jgi:hypothetical protein
MEAWLPARSLGSVRAKIALSVALGDRGKVIKAAIAKVRAAEVTDTAEAGPQTPRPASDGPEPGPRPTSAEIVTPCYRLRSAKPMGSLYYRQDSWWIAYKDEWGARVRRKISPDKEVAEEALLILL